MITTGITTYITVITIATIWKTRILSALLNTRRPPPNFPPMHSSYQSPPATGRG